MSIILGFDFGMKKIGVATGQTITQTATPLCNLKAQDGVPNWDEMDALFKHWEPTACVIGLPFNADGTESFLVPRARAFGRKLKNRYASYGISCHFIDEHLSSFEARQLMKDTEGFKKNSKKNVKLDATAAMIILESWLSTHQ